MTKYYIDADGNYLGGFCGLNPTFNAKGKQITTGWEDIIIPDGAIEISHAPDDARQVWNFKDNDWLPMPTIIDDVVENITE